MPERDMPEQPGGSQQGAGAGDWSGTPRGAGPTQQQWGGEDPSGYGGQPQGGQQWDNQQWGGADPSQYAGQQWGGQPESNQQPGGQPWGGPQWGSQAGWDTPVHMAETRVTGRRIIQYWIDSFLVSIVPMLVSIPFDRSNSTLLNVLGGVVYVVLFVLIGLWYWVIRPHSHNGQTFAMKWFGLRAISKHGGPATMTQLFVRWIALLIDSAPWFWPVSGLVGLIVMLCSKYRQRIGDHLARTLVVDARFGGMTRQQEYAGAGQSGLTRSYR